MSLTERPVYRCSCCGYDFSVTSGTIMHDSHLPLRKWLVAIYLICESKKGISKRSIVGSFHKVSAKHIDRYISELERRFNNRGNDHIFMDALRRIVRTRPTHLPRTGGVGYGES